jgi:ApaG protein
MEITESFGIKVSVQSQYSLLQSNPDLDEYFFSYQVTISNNGTETVQLLKRRWEISDSNGENRIVEGDGVVGVQPVIEPGEYHKYTSGCLLKSAIGRMKGNYTLIKIVDNEQFVVDIPEFGLRLPWLDN